MKKLGFTLAEVLIALAIIGVVAAITLPTLSTSTKKETNAAKVQVAVSDLENAFTTMLAKEVVTDLDEAAIADGNLIDTLSNYIKISDTSTTDEIKFVMKNGIEVKPEADTFEHDMLFTIDVNGFNQKPNTENIDQFAYYLKRTGMLDVEKDPEETTTEE